MRKFILAFFILCLSLTVNVSAASGDVIGKIYSTDILATINGVPVESYNIGGRTAIILEDLERSGVDVYYNDKIRTLLVYMHDFSSLAPDTVKRGKTGRIVGNIYESDIVTYVNGKKINTFSLNGKMAVVIEELGDNGVFSDYGAKYKWNEDSRTIALEFLYDNFLAAMQILKNANLAISFTDDTAKLSYEYFNFGGISCTYSENFNHNASTYPVYVDLNGEKEYIGMAFKEKLLSFYHDDDNNISLYDGGLGFYICYDLEKLQEIISRIDVPARTYDDVLNHYLGPTLFATCIDRIDAKDYTFLYMSQGTPHGQTQFLVRICRNGEYHDYATDFKSVSIWGTKIFDNVKIDKVNETVTFSYDKAYTIDLKTGIIK